MNTLTRNQVEMKNSGLNIGEILGRLTYQIALR